jgi:acetyl-CoA acyltransferase
MSSKPVYIVASNRSAIGKAFRGSLATRRPDDFGAELLRKTLGQLPKFDYGEIEDVIVGCAMPEAEQGMNVARFIALLSGIPETVPAYTINRFCSSGLQSIAIAADRIMAGHAECVVAGGVESMSLIPMMGHKVVGSRKVNDEHPDFYLGMGMTAENVADEYKISRGDQDEFALKSHQKATNAIENKMFREEIIGVEYEKRKLNSSGAVNVSTEVFEQDEGPRPDSTITALAKLSPVFKLGGTVTAGNSSQMSDGAAFSVLCSEEFVKRHNLTPIARFCGFSAAGVPPRVMGIGPVEAIPKALKHTQIKLGEIDRIELNEAFAAQALAVIRTLKLNQEIVNPTGGAIAMGHPLGATGAKLTASLIHGMRRDRQRYGMVTMCIGTGMGAAGILECL